MSNEPEYITFFRDWHLLAEGRDTDEKRLAFYDAIFRYAFDGEVPEKPKRGESTGKVWAAWDAYVTTHTIIDKLFKKMLSGRAGGKAGRGESKARIGNRNASKTQADEEQNASKTQDINRNINRDRNIDRNVSVCVSHTAPTLTPETDPLVQETVEILNTPSKPITIEEVRQWCTQLGITGYADTFFKEASEVDWGYTNRAGVYIRMNRRNCKGIIKSFHRTWIKSHCENDVATRPSGRPINIKPTPEEDLEDVF